MENKRVGMVVEKVSKVVDESIIMNNDDTSSIETLLSEWSDSSEDEEYYERRRRRNKKKSKRKRLEKTFRMRDKILDEMTKQQQQQQTNKKGSSSSSSMKYYIDMLKQNEMLVRNEAFRLLELEEEKEKEKETTTTTIAKTTTITAKNHGKDNEYKNCISDKKMIDSKVTATENNKVVYNESREEEEEEEENVGQRIHTKDDKKSPSEKVITAKHTTTTNIESSILVGGMEKATLLLFQYYYQIIRNHLLYEFGIIFPGYIMVFFYCSATMASYEFIYSLLTEQVRYFPYDESYFFGVMLVFALLLLRFSGGLWEYSNDTNYSIAKFELHNRIRLKTYIDANIHLWFRKHPTLKNIAHYLSLYLCLIGFNYFQFKLLGLIFADREWFINKLPSINYGDGTIITPIQMWMKGEFLPPCNHTDVITTEGEETVYSDSLKECYLLDQLTMEDYYMLQQTMSLSSFYALFGSINAHVMTPLVHLATQFSIAGISMYMLYKLGFSNH